MVIPQWPHDIYFLELLEAFREGLRTKVKMAIISMSWRTLAEVVELTIMIEEKMQIRKKSIARYCQDSDNDESKHYDEEKK